MNQHRRSKGPCAPVSGPELPSLSRSVLYRLRLLQSGLRFRSSPSRTRCRTRVEVAVASAGFELVGIARFWREATGVLAGEPQPCEAYASQQVDGQTPGIQSARIAADPRRRAVTGLLRQAPSVGPAFPKLSALGRDSCSRKLSLGCTAVPFDAHLAFKEPAAGREWKAISAYRADAVREPVSRDLVPKHSAAPRLRHPRVGAVLSTVFRIVAPSRPAGSVRPRWNPRTTSPACACATTGEPAKTPAATVQRSP